jgi:hypothetical protein
MPRSDIYSRAMLVAVSLFTGAPAFHGETLSSRKMSGAHLGTHQRTLADLPRRRFAWAARSCSVQSIRRVVTRNRTKRPSTTVQFREVRWSLASGSGVTHTTPTGHTGEPPRKTPSTCTHSNARPAARRRRPGTHARRRPTFERRCQQRRQRTACKTRAECTVVGARWLGASRPGCRVVGKWCGQGHTAAADNDCERDGRLCPPLLPANTNSPGQWHEDG